MTTFRWRGKNKWIRGGKTPTATWQPSADGHRWLLIFSWEVPCLSLCQILVGTVPIFRLNLVFLWIWISRRLYTCYQRVTKLPHKPPRGPDNIMFWRIWTTFHVIPSISHCLFIAPSRPPPPPTGILTALGARLSWYTPLQTLSKQTILDHNDVDLFITNHLADKLQNTPLYTVFIKLRIP